MVTVGTTAFVLAAVSSAESSSESVGVLTELAAVDAHSVTHCSQILDTAVAVVIETA